MDKFLKRKAPLDDVPDGRDGDHAIKSPKIQQGASHAGKWRSIGDSCLLRVPTEPLQSYAQPPYKLACFDMDDTLVKTKSGRLNYARESSDDWQFLNDNVKSKVQDAHKGGHVVVIFSNQAQVKSKHAGPAAQKVKAVADKFLKEIGVPAYVFYATQKDKYRKPGPGMWEHFVKHVAGGSANIDMEASFFVGDAAGRPGDHSDADIGFARTARLQFYTPEEFFT